MLVSKDSSLVKVFRELVKEDYNPRTSKDVSFVKFCNNCVSISFEDRNISRLLVNVPTEFEDVCVGQIIIPAILSEVDANGSVEITVSDNKMIVGSWEIGLESSSISSTECNWSNPDVVVGKETFANFEKDFAITIGNACINTKIIDVIGLLPKDGTLYEICPSECVYKIAKVKTEAISIEGIDTKIFLVPRKVYNVVKCAEGDVSIWFSGSEILFKSNDVAIGYNVVDFGMNAFNRYLDNFYNSTSSIEFDMNAVRPAIEKLRMLCSSDFSTYENSVLEIKNNKITVKSAKLNIDVDTNGMEISTLLPFFVDIYSRYSEGSFKMLDTETSTSTSAFVCGDECYMFPNLS